MDNNIPEGWAIPDDLAKKVNETLNKKRITPEDELADALEEMAGDIALIEPDPRDWGGWVIYLLEQIRRFCIKIYGYQSAGPYVQEFR